MPIATTWYCPGHPARCLLDLQRHSSLMFLWHLIKTWKLSNVSKRERKNRKKIFKKSIKKASKPILIYYHPTFVSFTILKSVREVKEIWGCKIKSELLHHNLFGHLLWNRKGSGIVIIGEITSIQSALPEPGPNRCSLDTCWHRSSQRGMRTLNH